MTPDRAFIPLYLEFSLLSRGWFAESSLGEQRSAFTWFLLLGPSNNFSVTWVTRETFLPVPGRDQIPTSIFATCLGDAVGGRKRVKMSIQMS